MVYQKAATVVLAQAAWADGSSWNRVMALLGAGGPVASAPLPRTCIADDAVAVDRLLARA